MSSAAKATVKDSPTVSKQQQPAKQDAKQQQAAPIQDPKLASSQAKPQQQTASKKEEPSTQSQAKGSAKKSTAKDEKATSNKQSPTKSSQSKDQDASISSMNLKNLNVEQSASATTSQKQEKEQDVAKLALDKKSRSTTVMKIESSPEANALDDSKLTMSDKNAMEAFLGDESLDNVALGDNFGGSGTAQQLNRPVSAQPEKEPNRAQILNLIGGNGSNSAVNDDSMQQQHQPDQIVETHSSMYLSNGERQDTAQQPAAAKPSEQELEQERLKKENQELDAYIEDDLEIEQILAKSFKQNLSKVDSSVNESTQPKGASPSRNRSKAAQSTKSQALGQSSAPRKPRDESKLHLRQIKAHFESLTNKMSDLSTDVNSTLSQHHKVDASIEKFQEQLDDYERSQKELLELIQTTSS